MFSRKDTIFLSLFAKILERKANIAEMNVATNFPVAKEKKKSEGGKKNVSGEKKRRGLIGVDIGNVRQKDRVLIKWKV